MIHTRALLRAVITPALGCLPPVMRSEHAEATLLAIALQESGLRHRQQVNGPAHGLFQFEPVGVRGVLDHPASYDYAQDACEAWLYPIERRPDGTATADSVGRVYVAIRDNDVLATILARLTLWRLPEPLAERDAPESGYAQYLESWRPGKPRQDHWADHWRTAWQAVTTGA